MQPKKAARFGVSCCTAASSARACSGLTTTRGSTWPSAGLRLALIFWRGLASKCPCSTAYPIAIDRAARFRLAVAGEAGVPSSLRDSRSKTPRSTVGSARSDSGRVFVAIHWMASWYCAGGSGVSRRAIGLNAQCMSASRSCLGSGGVPPVVIAVVTVVSPSAVLLRWRGDASGHLRSMTSMANSYQVDPVFAAMDETGRPDSVSKGSPRREAVISSARKDSASFLFANVRFLGFFPTRQRTWYVTRRAPLLGRISQMRTSKVVFMGGLRVRSATRPGRRVGCGVRRWGA